MASERLEIRNYSVDVSGDDFFITGQIMSSTLIPEAVLKAFIPKLKGKEVRLEHIKLEEEPNAFIGEVVDVWWDDKINAPFAKAKIENITAVDRSVRQTLIDDQKKPVGERTYKGFSIGIIVKKRNKVTEAIEDFFPRELTVTTDPVCEQCTIQTVSVYSNMAEKNAVEALLKEQLEAVKQQAEKKNAEFSGALKTMTEKLADKEKAMNDRVTELQKETETYKNHLKEKDAEISKLAEQARQAKVEPYVNTLLEVAQFGKNDIAKAKKELWMKYDEGVLKEFAEYADHMAKLFGQKLPVVSGGQQLSIETFSGVPKADVGSIKMDNKTARSVLG
jgi:predicted RNase H-like nuclease (RuvC/YqgF family)